MNEYAMQAVLTIFVPAHSQEEADEQMARLVQYTRDRRVSISGCQLYIDTWETIGSESIDDEHVW